MIALVTEAMRGGVVDEAMPVVTRVGDAARGAVPIVRWT
jgi:hypothetical protein